MLAKQVLRAGSVLALTVLLSQLTACVPLVVAGAAGGVVAAQDRRPTAVLWNDQQIGLRVGERIDAKFGNASHVNVNSFNRAVLLTGEVPDEATRVEVERLARETQDVKQVYNEVAVMLPSSLSARAADTGLTTRLKARMLDSKRFSPIHVKVTSERSTVYLMGLVTRQEAKDSAEVASQTPGVEKVITLFEFID
ncbi:BON domain-containing protein [Chitinimonas sp.]|uniref:BON domain-containing protein n=1 Tax=Chitinimonas sp. TaxID=1934313 RepID=UPI0035B4396D